MEIEDNHLSGRALARTWPYPRRAKFQRELRATAASYFANKGWAVDDKYAFILAKRADW